MIAGGCHLVQDTGTGQSVQVSLTSKPKQVSLDRTERSRPEYDSKDLTAGTEQPRQDSQERKPGRMRTE
jgi:hypothetical protein